MFRVAVAVAIAAGVALTAAGVALAGTRIALAVARWFDASSS